MSSHTSFLLKEARSKSSRMIIRISWSSGLPSLVPVFHKIIVLFYVNFAAKLFSFKSCHKIPKKIRSTKSVCASCHNYNSTFHWALFVSDLHRCWGKFHLLLSRLFSFVLGTFIPVFSIIQILDCPDHSAQSAQVWIIEVWRYIKLTHTLKLSQTQYKLTFGGPSRSFSVIRLPQAFNIQENLWWRVANRSWNN